MTDTLSFRTRTLERVSVLAQGINIDRLGGAARFVPFASITSWQKKRSIYDLPFLETTIVLYLADGRKVKLKRLPRRQVPRLVDSIERGTAPKSM